MVNPTNLVVRYNMKAPNYELHHIITTDPFDITYHNHDFYEVLYFISGNLNYMIEGTTYKLRPGDILLTHNKEMHKPIIDFSKPYERYILWINPRFIRELSDNSVDLSSCFELASQNNSHLLRPSSTMHLFISNLFKSLVDTDSDDSFGNSLLQKSYITTLLIYLNRISSENLYEIEYESDYDPIINAIIQYINDNLHESISLDDIANEFYLSKYHLCRIFKKNVGLTIYQYIMKKRLIIAKSLLISGSSVRSAYINSGFSDYSNFLKSFKNEFGVSPKSITMPPS